MTALAGVIVATALGLAIALSPTWTELVVLGIGLGILFILLNRSDAVWRWVLTAVLLGYVVLTRGFAYSSFNPRVLGLELDVPVYIGEILLIWALVSIRHGVMIPEYLRTPGARWLTLWIGVGIIRVILDVPTYGVAALRDAAICYYGIFAYIGYAFAEHPRHVKMLLRILGFGFLLHLGYSVIYLFHIVDVGAISPHAPGSSFPIFWYRHDASAVNLVAGALFAMLLAGHFGWPVWLRWAAALPQIALFAALQVRAAYVGFAFGAGVLVYAGRLRQVLRVAVALLLLLTIAAALSVEGTIEGQTASAFSARRIFDSLVTIFDIEGTGTYRYQESQFSVDNVRWRLEFWELVAQRNLESPQRLLLGSGFGPLLVTEGKFLVNAERPNRNPHNIVVTIFGRTGVIGLVLWVGFVVASLREGVQGIREALRRRDPRARDVSAFLVAYIMAILGAAFFGVLLESPFMAIPWYFLLGLAVKLRRSRAAMGGTTDWDEGPTEKEAPSWRETRIHSVA